MLGDMYFKRYIRGIVFPISLVKAAKGFDLIEEDINLIGLCRMILVFLTEDIRDAHEARERVDNDIDELVENTRKFGIIPNHIVENDVSCLKYTNILISICHTWILMFEDCAFYEDCKSNLIGRPRLEVSNSERSFILLVRKKLNTN